MKTESPAVSGIKRWLTEVSGFFAIHRSDLPPPFLSAIRPLKSAVPHPMDRLTFFNGAIHEIYRGQPGREYLPLSGIEIIGKLVFQELTDGQCEYQFELNLAPDGIWLRFFKVVAPGLSVRIENRTLGVSCLPADLEATYEHLKRTIESVNLLYAREREELIPQVIALDDQRRLAVEFEENRKLGLKRQFDCLEL